MAWPLRVDLANPVVSFRADCRPVRRTETLGRHVVYRFKPLPCRAGSSSAPLFSPSSFGRSEGRERPFDPPSDATRAQDTLALGPLRLTMAVRTTILVLFATLAVVSAAGLLETLLSWELPDAEARSTTPESKCLCQTSGCLCCADLNLTTTLDLGGPACVNIKQKEQNVTLNMSYGDNPIHNATIKIVDAANKPTCMNLLSDLAQICGRFTSMKQSDSGYDGCLVIEPALLGSPQATYLMGCFNFNQGSVRQVEPSAITETTETSGDEEEDTLNTDELLAAVSASAEHGIALFSQWLGLSLNPKLNQTSRDNEPKQSSSHQQVQQVEVTSRSGRAMIQEGENYDERFKQLLSAQDNVLRGSATIGQPSDAQTTFVYSKPAELIRERNSPVEAKAIDSSRLTMVPKESRRGGRAYNIHQHVNEI